MTSRPILRPSARLAFRPRLRFSYGSTTGRVEPPFGIISVFPYSQIPPKKPNIGILPTTFTGVHRIEQYLAAENAVWSRKLGGLVLLRIRAGSMTNFAGKRVFMCRTPSAMGHQPPPAVLNENDATAVSSNGVTSSDNGCKPGA